MNEIGLTETTTDRAEAEHNRSASLARPPRKQPVGRDHRNHDQHPILTLDAQESEGLNEELHGIRLFSRRTIYVFQPGQYIFYIFSGISRGFGEITSSARRRVRRLCRGRLDRQAVEEFLERLFAGQFGILRRRKAALPQRHAHRFSFAAYFPIP